MSKGDGTSRENLLKLSHRARNSITVQLTPDALDVLNRISEETSANHSHIVRGLVMMSLRKFDIKSKTHVSDVVKAGILRRINSRFRQGDKAA